MEKKKKAALIILDGWGIRKSKKENGVKLSEHSFFDKLIKKHPNSTLDASAMAVGLPEGYMGNSEVGHLTLGAGRIIPQKMIVINKAIKNKSFYKNKTLLDAAKHVKKNKSSLHIIGLLSDAGVHSHIDHLFAILDFAKKNNLNNVYVHCFMDGRDTPVDSGIKYIKKLQTKINDIGIGKIAAIIGRYYAMDRDSRWKRIKIAYDCLINGKGEYIKEPIKALKKSYKNNIGDEFVKPVIIDKDGIITDNDSIIFFNFRSDRARQLTKALIENKFDMFKRNKLKNIKFVPFTKYYENLKCDTAYPSALVKNSIGEYISKRGIKQLRIAESEKYAHVTYFFSGGKHAPYKYETRILVNSKKVPTYDLAPSMSAKKITDNLIKIGSRYSLIILNYANPDMVGHTGNLDAVIKALHYVDAQLKRSVKFLQKEGFEIIVTADHGNCEEMSGVHKTTHTLNKVPCIYIGKKKIRLNDGGLKDISPTLLDLLEQKKPKEMTGKSLLANQ